jgi:dCTP deaminase
MPHLFHLESSLKIPAANYKELLMILTDEQIEQAIANGDIEIDPFSTDRLQPASYDLSVGAQAVTTSSQRVIDLAAEKYFVLKPGDFGIVISHEVIRLSPHYTARFGLTSSLARKGLIATSGPQVDPGYHGRLILGITNLTPHDQWIAHLDKFLTLEFHRLEKPPRQAYIGKYQDRMNLTEEEISIIAGRYGTPLVQSIKAMEGLENSVRNLSMSSKVSTWIVGAGFAALAAGFATLAIVIATKA